MLLNTLLDYVHEPIPSSRHRWSQTLIPTTREAPSDAQMPSHIFMTRAGYIRPVGAGIVPQNLDDLSNSGECGLPRFYGST